MVMGGNIRCTSQQLSRDEESQVSKNLMKMEDHSPDPAATGHDW